MDAKTGNARSMIGFETEQQAYASARRRGQWGCTGSGQLCCTVQLSDNSWAVWTAHSAFHPRREPGHLLIPRRLIDLRGPATCAVVEEFRQEEGIADAW